MQYCRLFARVNQPLEVDENRLRQALDDLFQPSDDINWQKVAAAVALTRRVSVISGGLAPGKPRRWRSCLPRWCKWLMAHAVAFVLPHQPEKQPLA
jgi:hypothetical protein